MGHDRYSVPCHVAWFIISKVACTKKSEEEEDDSDNDEEMGSV